MVVVLAASNGLSSGSSGGIGRGKGFGEWNTIAYSRQWQWCQQQVMVLAAVGEGFGEWDTVFMVDNHST